MERGKMHGEVEMHGEGEGAWRGEWCMERVPPTS